MDDKRLDSEEVAVGVFRTVDLHGHFKAKHFKTFAPLKTIFRLQKNVVSFLFDCNNSL